MKNQPIILIPGIQGTKLTNSNEVDFKLIWSGIKKFFSNIHALALQKDGISDAKPEAIIERADVEDMAYSEIVNYLRELGYPVYIFGYDWRKSNVYTGLELQEYVNKLKKKLNVQKVNFITHSMGGLVLSGYMSLLKKEEIDKTINKVIFTVPPFLGSIEATFNLVIGKSRLFNSSDDFRKVGRTFPGLYELLPVYKAAYEMEGGGIDFYNADTYWQQEENISSPEKYKIIKDRLKALGKVRTQNNFIFDLSKLNEEVRKRFIILAGGGEETKTKIKIDKNKDGFKFLFDFEAFDEEEDGDGTVPLGSAIAFKDSITTFKVDTTWFEKRVDSKYIMNDWHAFFLNNGKVQNIIKRFIDPEFNNNENWYQSIGKRIEKL